MLFIRIMKWMCYHYTTPGLTWDCGFKHTKQKIELLQDVDMLLMFENMIRGKIFSHSVVS